jgi:allophanate hydrolase subunit 1
VSATASAIIERLEASGGKPSVTIRQAGDRAVLVEFGEMEFDLTLNFLVQAIDDALRRQPVEGLIETAPGFRSILVTFDPLAIAEPEIVAHLGATYDGLEAEAEMTIPSRLIHLPVAFDDSQTRAAVERYVNTIRKDAPNTEGGNNIDYMVRYNGLSDREELYESVLATEHWSAFIGFFPGLPFMFPLDPRHAVIAPKYNPTRTWTAEGTLGLGGPCWAIYPVESAGGYQLIGRTIPIYDLAQHNAAFRDNPLLMRAGDRVSFHRIEEDELLALFEDVRADRYRYRVEDGTFDVGAFLRFTEDAADETAERRARRERAAAETPVP